MTVDYIVYDSEGAIVRHGKCSKADLHLQAEPGETAVEGLGDDATHWFNPAISKVELRPVMIQGVSSLQTLVDKAITVTDIPAGAILHHPDGQTQIDDGYFEWSSSVPGKFTLKLTLFPYQDEIIHAEVTP